MRPIATIALAIAVVLTLAHAAPAQEPVNKIVLVLDSSGSFKNRQAEAVKRSVAMLEDLSQTKLKRWEAETDHVVIIALDAMPEVIWNGTGKELKATDANQWTARFAARKTMAYCTDLTKAITLALSHLDGDPRFVSKYLIVFSDLIHEPPTTSLRACAKCQLAPPADFPWDGLGGISVSVFWLPDEQKFTWNKAVEKHGLSQTVALFSPDQSNVQKITPPPRPVEKVSESEQAAARETIKDGLVLWAKRIGMVAGAIIGLPVIVLVIRNLIVRRRSRGGVRPSAPHLAGPGNGPRPVQNPGPGLVAFPGRPRR